MAAKKKTARKARLFGLDQWTTTEKLGAATYCRVIEFVGNNSAGDIRKLGMIPVREVLPRKRGKR